MARLSTVDRMSDADREWFEAELVRRRFAGYAQLVEDCAARGIEISISSAHRHGQDFKARLERVRLITEQARAVVNESPDDEGKVNEALMRLVQEKLFDLLEKAQYDVDGMTLTQIARAIADLGRASVSQKRMAAEVRRQALEDAAAQVETTGRQQGLTAEGVEAMKQAIMGAMAA